MKSIATFCIIALLAVSIHSEEMTENQRNDDCLQAQGARCAGVTDTVLVKKRVSNALIGIMAKIFKKEATGQKVNEEQKIFDQCFFPRV